MGKRLIVPVLALLAAALPRGVTAGVTNGDLGLNPASGAQGSHFTATLSFTASPCNAYHVYFYWDVPNGPTLGGTDVTGAGPTCTVSMDLVVPSTDAAPGHSYQVAGDAQTKQVAGTAANSSTYNGAAQFDVTNPPSLGPGGGSPGPGGPGQGNPSASTPRPAGSSSGTGAPAPGGSATPTSSDTPDSSAPPDISGSPDATEAPLPVDGSHNGPPVAVETPHAPATGGVGGAVILGAAAFLAVLLAGAWTYRTGRLRALFRR